MAEFDQGDGVVVDIDDQQWAVSAVAAAAPTPTRRTRGGLPRAPVPLGPTAGGGGGDELTDALAGQGFELLKTVDLSRSRSATRSSPATEPVIHVDADPNEHAVVLVAKDGVYEWVLPEPTTASPAPGSRARRLRSGPSSTKRRLSFPIPTGPAPRRSRSWASKLLGDGIRAFVLKFVARAITPVAIRFLERNVTTRLVALDHTEPDKWSPVDDADAMLSSQPRILLFVHGTFSSTVGAFHGLAATQTGCELLQWARGHYDEVVGFDHPTLSVDPLHNARELWQHLQRRYGDATPRIDIVCHSRGGLVTRSLVERVLPGQTWRPEIGRVVMVGCTNGGTHLAEPDNWKPFVDLYTSLAAQAVKLVTTAFAATTLGTVLGEAIKSVGALVKHLAVHMIAEEGVPGLAAMRPGGPFVTELNQTNPGQPGPASFRVHVVTSDFEPDQVDASSAGALTASLCGKLVDHLADGLLAHDSDLVVDTALMDVIDPDVGGFIEDRLDFGPNGWVHHLAYFVREETARALRRWLDTQGPARLPAVVHDRIWIVEGSGSADALRRFLELDPGRPFVIRRPDVTPDTMYGFDPREVADRIAGIADLAARSIAEVLELHETDATPPAAVETLRRRRSLPAPANPARLVPVTSGGELVGVLKSLDGAAPAILPAPVAANGGGTRRTRSWDAAGDTGAAPDDVPQTARLFMQAEMPAKVRADAPFDVIVQLSREALAAAAGAAVASAAADVGTADTLRVTVSPRSGVIFEADTVAEVDLPAAGQPHVLLFSARAVTEGPAEIWVFVRQGPKLVAQLTLSAVVVAADVAVAGGNVSVEGSATPDDLVFAEPSFTLRVGENKLGDEIRLEFELYSREHDLWDVYEGAPIIDAPKFIASMYEQLESDWVSNKDDAVVLDLKLSAYGKQLYNDLLPEPLRRKLWKHRGDIEAILVVSTETYVPWEMLHMSDPDAPNDPTSEKLFLGQKGLVRWLHKVGVQPRDLTVRAGRVRHIVPNYPSHEHKLPAAQLEATFMKDAFGSVDVGAHSSDLYSLLQAENGFDLLHFAGHGEANPASISQAAILFEGRVDNGSWVPARAEALLVKQLPVAPGQTARPIVFLNACQVGRAGTTLGSVGGFAQAFLHRRAGAFVAPLWAVGDMPAFTFGKALYESFVRGGKPLAEAVKLAREAALASGDPSWIAYAVYGHHDARVTLSGFA